jgi:hypothetical protein
VMTVKMTDKVGGTEAYFLIDLLHTVSSPLEESQCRN